MSSSNTGATADISSASALSADAMIDQIMNDLGRMSTAAVELEESETSGHTLTNLALGHINHPDAQELLSSLQSSPRYRAWALDHLRTKQTMSQVAHKYRFDVEPSDRTDPRDGFYYPKLDLSDSHLVTGNDNREEILDQVGKEITYRVGGHFLKNMAIGRPTTVTAFDLIDAAAHVMQERTADPEAEEDDSDLQAWMADREDIPTEKLTDMVRSANQPPTRSGSPEENETNRGSLSGMRTTKSFSFGYTPAELHEITAEFVRYAKRKVGRNSRGQEARTQWFPEWFTQGRSAPESRKGTWRDPEFIAGKHAEIRRLLESEASGTGNDLSSLNLSHLGLARKPEVRFGTATQLPTISGHGVENLDLSNVTISLVTEEA